MPFRWRVSGWRTENISCAEVPTCSVRGESWSTVRQYVQQQVGTELLFSQCRVLRIASSPSSPSSPSKSSIPRSPPRKESGVRAVCRRCWMGVIVLVCMVAGLSDRVDGGWWIHEAGSGKETPNCMCQLDLERTDFSKRLGSSKLPCSSLCSPLYTGSSQWVWPIEVANVSSRHPKWQLNQDLG